MCGEGRCWRVRQLPARIGVSGDAELFRERGALVGAALGDSDLDALAQFGIRWRLLRFKLGFERAEARDEGQPAIVLLVVPDLTGHRFKLLRQGGPLLGRTLGEGLGDGNLDLLGDLRNMLLGRGRGSIESVQHLLALARRRVR